MRLTTDPQVQPVDSLTAPGEDELQVDKTQNNWCSVSVGLGPKSLLSSMSMSLQVRKVARQRTKTPEIAGEEVGSRGQEEPSTAQQGLLVRNKEAPDTEPPPPSMS